MNNKIKINPDLKYQAFDKDVKSTGYFKFTFDKTKDLKKVFGKFKMQIEQIFKDAMILSRDGKIGKRKRLKISW